VPRGVLLVDAWSGSPGVDAVVTALVLAASRRSVGTPDDRGKDLFVHRCAIAGDGFRSLAEGAKVSYDTEQGRKGPAAANVRLI